MEKVYLKIKKKLLKANVVSITILLLFTFNTQASNCVDNFKWVIRSQVNTTFDQNIINWAIKNRMFSDELKGFKQKVKSEGFGPESINEMLDQISDMIKQNHPAIEEYACFLKTKNIKISKDAAKEVRITLHYMLALEVLTKSMSKNKVYMGIVQDYLMKKREAFLVDRKGEKLKIKKVVGKSNALKITLLDSAFNEYIEFRDKTDFSRINLLKKNLGLLANIKWASKTDKNNGYTDNYQVGNNFLTSSSYLPTGLVEDIWLDDNYLVRQEFKKNWTKLYQSWNLAFILGNMKDLYLFLPKLLIPSVLSADENAYLMTRTMALWTTINFALFHDINLLKFGKKLPQLDVSQKLAKKLGQINLKYAKEVIK